MKRPYTKPLIRTCRVEDSEPLLAASETQITSTVSFDNLAEDEQPGTTDYDGGGSDGSRNCDF